MSLAVFTAKLRQIAWACFLEFASLYPPEPQPLQQQQQLLPDLSFGTLQIGPNLG